MVRLPTCEENITFHWLTIFNHYKFLCFVSPEFASIIHEMVGGKSVIINKDAMEDDPQRRKPDITRATNMLGWQPLVGKCVCVQILSLSWCLILTSLSALRLECFLPLMKYVLHVVLDKLLIFYCLLFRYRCKRA